MRHNRKYGSICIYRAKGAKYLVGVPNILRIICTGMPYILGYMVGMPYILGYMVGMPYILGYMVWGVPKSGEAKYPVTPALALAI